MSKKVRQVFIMKLFIKSICAAAVICIIFSMIPFSAQCRNVSGEIFRLHILANSDSEHDQALKLKVRDRVLKLTEKIYKGSDSLADAELLTADNIQAIADAASDELRKNNCAYPVKVEIKNMYFKLSIEMI